MKVSLKWLSEYVDVPDTLQDFCDRLDLTGTGVEGVERIGDSFDHVVTGKIISKEAHPDSDHMWVTRVDVGEHNVNDQGVSEPLQIVCGAQNFNEGDHVVVALIGAVLPGDFKIKKSKLRGVTSHGMNCSERELGLGSDHEGIMILPQGSPIGMPFADYYGMADTILDLEITPNRPDCLSIVGFAREVGAIYDTPLRMPERALTETDKHVGESVRVTVEDPDRSPRYTARVIRNVKVGPSPEWLVERLASIGQRSVNNVVDVTNYVLFELGQPLHTFDFDTLDVVDGKADIVIRAARDGEKLTTLDGAERELTSDMTVIATNKRAVALAGVMGGLDSEVSEKTTTILLEAATFSPVHTSRTSRNLGLISEASLRYERKVDAFDIDKRSSYAAALIAEVSGGTVDKGLVDVWQDRTGSNRHLQLRLERCSAFIGANISTDFITTTLTNLGCRVSNKEDGVLDVEVPSFRPDLEREIDLYEEVLRLYGMDKIPSTLPGGRGRIGMRSYEQDIARTLHKTLTAAGLNETLTYSFADNQDIEKLGFEDADGALGEAVELINPINSEQGQLRRTLLPGLLRSVSYNQNRGVRNVELYEMGTIFATKEGAKKPKERTSVVGVLAGSMHEKAWNRADESFDFFDGKGILESVAREFALPKVRFKEADLAALPYLQPGCAAMLYSGGAEIAWIGEIHPQVAQAFDVRPPVVAFEIYMPALQKSARPARDFRDVPQFPGIERDISLVVDSSTRSEQLQHVLESAGGKLLEHVRVFDVYTNEEQLGEHKKALAFRLTYRSPERTLTSDEVDVLHAKVLEKTKRATQAQER
ncbi:MAG: phenylalanine--tRNA ligase subunit beta [Eggerthellaceae bacterium]|nr:phenylalanine--tRNA ligase subunit beta [Eggerthellaceae bacterium]